MQPRGPQRAERSRALTPADRKEQGCCEHLTGHADGEVGKRSHV